MAEGSADIRLCGRRQRGAEVRSRASFDSGSASEVAEWSWNRPLWFRRNCPLIARMIAIRIMNCAT